jgi:hypothetical protein
MQKTEENIPMHNTIKRFLFIAQYFHDGAKIYKNKDLSIFRKTNKNAKTEESSQKMIVDGTNDQHPSLRSS